MFQAIGPHTAGSAMDLHEETNHGDALENVSRHAQFHNKSFRNSSGQDQPYVRRYQNRCNQGFTFSRYTMSLETFWAPLDGRLSIRTLGPQVRVRIGRYTYFDGYGEIIPLFTTLGDTTMMRWETTNGDWRCRGAETLQPGWPQSRDQVGSAKRLSIYPNPVLRAHVARFILPVSQPSF